MGYNKVKYFHPGITDLEAVRKHADKCWKRTGQHMVLEIVPPENGHDG